MVKNYPTITIGIPAHNEEGNIGALMNAMLEQRGSFVIEKLIVVCDGCADNTENIARKVSEKNPLVITVINDGKRLGKSARLNQIYRMNQSDFLATFDADILPASLEELQKMLNVAKLHDDAQVIGGHMITVLPKKGIMPKILQVNHKLWDLTTRIYNDGKNIHTSYGQAYLLRKDFVKKFIFPDNITCDQGFLYFSVQPDGYYFAHDSSFLINPVLDIKEAKVNFGRTINERNDLTKIFGEGVIKAYRVPIYPRLSAIMMMFFETPFYTLGAIGYNVWVKYAHSDDPERSNGLWSIIKSTKGPVQ